MQERDIVTNDKLLDVYQAIIARMAGNSSSLKGWGVSVATAVIGFAVKDGPSLLAWLALVPLLLFFALDAYYLAAERIYRKKFNMVVAATDKLELTIEGGLVSFSAWLQAASRPVTWGVYLVLGVVAIAVAAGLGSSHKLSAAILPLATAATP